MKKQIQKGFTLIELMIVVAIIAILAAIAIPQYQNYVARSQVSRVMGETSAVKTAIEDCKLNNKAADECFIGWTVSNLVGASGAGGNASGGTSGSNSTAAAPGQVGLTVADYDSNTPSVVATFGQNAASVLQASTQTIGWYRNAEGSWACQTNVDAKFRPTGCAAL